VPGLRASHDNTVIVKRPGERAGHSGFSMFQGVTKEYISKPTFNRASPPPNAELECGFRA